MTPDYHGLNVYWLARDGVNDEELDKLLQCKSAPLRHELTQLHLVGIVPRIKFIKGKYSFANSFYLFLNFLLLLLKLILSFYFICLKFLTCFVGPNSFLIYFIMLRLYFPFMYY